MRRPLLVTVLSAIAGLACLALWLGLASPIPAPPAFERVRAGWKLSELYLLDRNGLVIHEQRMDDKRRRLEWVALGDVSPALQASVLASEDRRFFAHGGVDGAPEAAVLAALLRAPNAEVPAVVTRAERLSTGAGPSRASLEAVAAQALAAPVGAGPRVLAAPHAASRLARDLPTGPGRPVRMASTLDGRLQRFAAETLARQLLLVREQRVRDGAVLVVDNASGEVLAYVGGSGNLSDARFVDLVQARRQAGSALKPFLYGLAFDERLLTPASLLEDGPLEVATPTGLYRPHNYDERFRGFVSARTALAGSLNVPAVRTLGLVGADAMVGQLRRFGFAGVTEGGEFYGPSLALGSADVSLWEMVGAYRALATGGVWSPLSMRPGEGTPKAEGRRVLSEGAVFLVSSILSDRESRGVTFGLENPLSTRFWTAVKTGTSKEMRDNWAVGYSSRYTVGVWVGNAEGEPMKNVSGVTGAAPVWLEVMGWLHARTPSVPPAPPRGIARARVAFAGEAEPAREEWFAAGTEPAAPAGAPTAILPRIVAPVGGTIFALDPDIPEERQRVAFESHGAAPGHRWLLDGTVLGEAVEFALWKPLAGRHHLSVVAVDGRVLDTVTFLVRGVDSAVTPSEER